MKSRFSVFLLIAATSLAPSALLAKGGDTDGCEKEPCLINPLKTTNFLGILEKVFNFLFLLAVVVGPLLIVYAGILMLFAAGSEEKIRTARQIITYTLIGFIIVVLAEGLVFILGELLTFPK